MMKKLNLFVTVFLLYMMSTFLTGCGCSSTQTAEDLANEEKLYGTWCAEIDATYDLATVLQIKVKSLYSEEQWRPEFDDLLNSYNAKAVYRWYVDYNKDGTCRYYANTEEYQEDMKEFTDQFAHIMAEIQYTLYEDEGISRALADAASIKSTGLSLEESIQASFTETIKEYGASLEKTCAYRVRKDSIIVTGNNGYYSDERFQFIDDNSMMLYLTEPYGSVRYERVQETCAAYSGI